MEHNTKKKWNTTPKKIKFFDPTRKITSKKMEDDLNKNKMEDDLKNK